MTSSPPLARPGSDEITVLIPAAGRVPEGLLALSNIACPAMIPVGGRPVVHWTLAYLRELGMRQFVIAVARPGMFIEDFVECVVGNECEVTFHVPSKDRGVGGTVQELLEQVTTKSALVVLGDTHFRFVDPDVLRVPEPLVLVNAVEDSYRWCVAETTPDGHLDRLRDKEPGLRGPVNALIGVYYFPDVAAAREAANAAAAMAQRRGSDKLELAAILDELGRTSPIRVATVGEWLDCGNADRQAAAHRALLEAREFNQLSIDPVFGTITKRSTRAAKLIDEINYLRALPPELAVLFPRIIQSATDTPMPSVTLEFYGYPSLAEVFVYENVDPAIWERVFRHILQVIEAFGRYAGPLPSAAHEQMYVAKTRERLRSLKAPPELLALVWHDGPVTINGRSVANLPSLWTRLEAEAKRLAGSGNVTIIHGDLCLSNILYDLRARICKLIDPRGSFGAAGIFGDPRYDIAKLYHSVHGLYDLITNDLFRVSVSGTDITLDIRAPAQQRDIAARFDRVFFGHFDRRDILLLTGLLFVSMPALHYDAPRRQLAMYARGLQLLDEALANGPVAHTPFALSPDQ